MNRSLSLSLGSAFSANPLADFHSNGKAGVACLIEKPAVAIHFELDELGPADPIP